MFFSFFSSFEINDFQILICRNIGSATFDKWPNRISMDNFTLSTRAECVKIGVVSECVRESVPHRNGLLHMFSHGAAKKRIEQTICKHFCVGLLFVYLLFHFGTLSLPASSLHRTFFPFLLLLSRSLPQFIVLSGSQRSQSSAESLKHWIACARAMAPHTLSLVYVVWVDGGANDSLM